MGSDTPANTECHWQSGRFSFGPPCQGNANAKEENARRRHKHSAGSTCTEHRSLRGRLGRDIWVLPSKISKCGVPARSGARVYNTSHGYNMFTGLRTSMRNKVLCKWLKIAHPYHPKSAFCSKKQSSPTEYMDALMEKNAQSSHWTNVQLISASTIPTRVTT